MTELLYRLRPCLAALLCCVLPATAQQLSIEPQKPKAPVILRPYLAPVLPPIRRGNSSRLASLVRAGKLYLTIQDAIALTLENNIDIEVERYNPIAATWQVERAQAGGALPGVPSGASQAGSVAAGQGVAGSQAAAGVSVNPANSNSGGAVNATISQIGPVTQNLDPSVQENTTFSHRTIPQVNLQQSLTSVLISNTRVYSGSYQQGFLTGGGVTVSYSEHYLNENAPTDVLNPSVAPNLSVSFQHNFLRGFGVAVNARNITVAKINRKTSDLNFRTRVTGTVVRVLNAYYALVGDDEDVRAKRLADQVAQTFLADSQRQIELGATAGIDIITAEARVNSSQQDLLLAVANREQQELQLKSLMSRTGVSDPVLANAEIVPIDRLAMPDAGELPPIEDLLRTALANRSDLSAERASLETAQVSALGTRNGLLPTLQAFGAESQAGLAGTPRTVIAQGTVEVADPYFVGGIGNALGQVFRRNFPTQRAGAFFQAPLENRQAQADYGIDQLQMRQQQLLTQKDVNQLGVDILNAVVAVRQARSRWESAVQNRVLQQQLLEAEQRRFQLGASVPFNVSQQQRDLVLAQSAETAALVAYNTARVSLDQNLGTTLETNHVAIADVEAAR